MTKIVTPVRFTQSGTFIVAVMLPIIIILTIMLFWLGFNDPFPAIIIISVIVTLIICLLIFYKLTIVINDTYLEFFFGPGLIKKRFELSDIEVCRPVKNPFWYGTGIHSTPDGWLYNVSGLNAVELTFRNKRSKIRIGTDKPWELSALINKMINKAATGHEYEADFDTSGRSGNIIPASVILAVFLMSVIIVVTGARETQLEYSDSSFRIKGMYGITADYQDIRMIDTISELPVISKRTNGYALKNTLKGNFILEDQSKVKMYVEKGNPPYIRIRTEDTEFYLNFKDPATTADIYSEIVSHIEKGK